MKLWLALAITAAAFFVLKYLVVPVAKESWRAQGNLAKYAKAGTLAAFKTLEDFLKIAAIVFAIAFFTLSFLTIIAPVFGASLLNAVYGCVDRVNEVTQPMRDGLGVLALWIAILAVFWAAWRMRAGDLKTALEEERRRQTDALLADHGKLEDLPLTTEMEKVAENITLCDRLAEDLAEQNSAASREKLEKLGAMRDAMLTQYVFLDIDRRINLSDVPVDDPVAADSSLWRTLRVGLFSRGMQQGLTTSGKWLKRIGTSAACLLVVGISTPVLASKGLLPTLGAINDIQVYRTQKEAQQSLAQIAKVAAEKQQATDERRARNDDDDDDEGDGLTSAGSVYRVAARQFARTLVASTDWRSSVHHANPDAGANSAFVQQADRIAEEVAIRDTLLGEFSDNARVRSATLRSAGFAEAAQAPEGARRRYGAFREYVAHGATAPRNTGVVDRLEQWMRAKAETSPVFRQRLIAGVESFREPATVGDMFGQVLDNALSSVVETALPDPEDASLFSKKGAGAGRDILQEPASRFVQDKLATFFADVEGGGGYAEALGRVREGGRSMAFFNRADAEVARKALAANEEVLSRVVASAEDVHPSLVRVDRGGGAARTERAVTRLQALASSSSEMRTAVEGSVGTYEDLFPSKAQAVDESPLGRALSKLFGADSSVAAIAADSPVGLADALGGGGGGSGGGKASTPKLASRNFARLRGSVRVGGVLIGVDPTGSTEVMDVRDIAWSIEGRSLAIRLLLKNRTIELGRFDGDIVQQALAYAADERPTTVTMTSGPLMPRMLRVHIHPALVDSALGCELMELDRFVDTATADWPERRYWEDVVRTQLNIYNYTTGDTQALYGFSDAAPFGAVTARVFPQAWRSSDPRMSVFAQSTGRFDMALVERMSECRARAAHGQASYIDCVRGEGFDQTLYQPQPYAIWSGVREKDYSGTLQELSSASFKHESSPFLRFMLQVAFERQPVCDEEPCDMQSTGPWEFPMIAEGIGNRTLALARGNPRASSIFIRANQFTALQRVFRIALSGKLGPAFPRQRLITLMRDAARADPIDQVETPDWNQSRIAARQDLLRALSEKGSGGDDSAIRDAQIEFMSGTLREGGDRFADAETCRGGSLSLH